MTWEPRSLPSITPETERYWTAAADHCLLLRRCSECGLTFHYPRAHCPDCLSSEVEWVEADGTGTVYSYTITENDDWPEDVSPIVVVYVELTEGPRMISNLVDCNPEDLEIGAPLSVRFVETKQDIAIPVFELDNR